MDNKISEAEIEFLKLNIGNFRGLAKGLYESKLAILCASIGQTAAAYDYCEQARYAFRNSAASNFDGCDILFNVLAAERILSKHNKKREKVEEPK